MTASTTPTSEREPARQYAGLLTEVMTNTMDQDYESVARSRGVDRGPRRRPAAALWAVAAVFGLMLGASAIRTEQQRPEADAERAELVAQIHQREDALDAMQGRLTDLRAEIGAMQNSLAAAVTDDDAMAAQLAELGAAAGTVAVSGPGVVITVDDAASPSGPGGTILDTDLQALVNGLWQSGAEAISINGHRLTTLTAIRYAGQAITVDYASLTPPYVITATGDPDTLPARLLQTPGGQAWLALRANFGITFEPEVRDAVTVPADPHDHLLYARQPKGGAR